MSDGNILKPEKQNQNVGRIDNSQTQDSVARTEHERANIVNQDNNQMQESNDDQIKSKQISCLNYAATLGLNQNIQPIKTITANQTTQSSLGNFNNLISNCVNNDSYFKFKGKQIYIIKVN